MHHRPTIAAGLALLTVVMSAAPFARAGQSPRVAHCPRVERAFGRTPSIEGGGRLSAAAPLTSTTATPRPTPTRRPTLDPTPHGGPIAVGAPLPTPAIAVDAITAANAFEVREVAHLSPPTDGNEYWRAFSPDGRMTFSVGGTGGLIARSLPNGAIVWRDGNTFLKPWPPLAVSPDGRTLAVAGNAGIDLRDAATGDILRSHMPSGSLRELTFADDGHTLAALVEDAYGAAWDVVSGTLLADRQVARDTGLSAHLRPGAAEVSAVPWPADGLTVFDLRSGQSRWSSQPSVGVRTGERTRWSPNGRHVVWTESLGQSAGNDRVCRSDLGAAPTCAPLAVFGGAPFTGSEVFPTNDGLVVAAGERHAHAGVCQRLGVDVWDGTGPMRTVFDGPGRNLDDLAVSPDGALLAMTHHACDGGPDRRTTLVALDSGRVVADLAGVVVQGFTPDGGRLVTQDYDGPVDRGLRLYGVVPGSGEGRRVFLPVGWGRP